MKNALVLAALVATAPVLAREHADPRGFRFTVPDTWRAIPPATIAQMLSALQQLGGASGVRYDAGYQLDGRADLAYPYLLVQWHDVRGGSLEDLAGALGGGAAARELQGTQQSLSEVMSGARAGAPTIDRARKLVAMTLDMEVAGTGPVKGYVFIFPGKSGAVQLNCYAAAAEAAEALPEFEAIVSSLRWDPGQGYGPRATFGERVLRGALIGAAIGAVIGLGRWLSSRAGKRAG